MTRTKIFFSLILFFTCSMHISGQDLHYSYYHFMPLSVNPANSGAFSGSYRVSGIYTLKDFGFSDQGFQNLSLSADAPIMRGIRKQDWIGIGFQADVFNPVNSAGTRFLANENDPNKAAQNWTFIKMSAAYHLALDKKQTNILTLGAQMSNGNRSLANFETGDTRSGIVNNFDSDLQKLKANFGQNGEFNFRTRDISMGLLFNARRKNSDLRLGFAMEGLFSPKSGFYSNSRRLQKDSVETKFFGLNIHGDYKMQINKRTSINPSFYYYSLGSANAFNVNSHVWYQINPENDFKGGVGVGVRNLRDVVIYLGAEFNDIQVGFAYDLNIDSRAVASSGLGGFEIAARYIGKIYKKPKVKPIVFCPRL